MPYFLSMDYILQIFSMLLRRMLMISLVLWL